VVRRPCHVLCRSFGLVLECSSVHQALCISCCVDPTWWDKHDLCLPHAMAPVRVNCEGAFFLLLGVGGGAVTVRVTTASATDSDLNARDTTMAYTTWLMAHALCAVSLAAPLPPLCKRRRVQGAGRHPISLPLSPRVGHTRLTSPLTRTHFLARQVPSPPRVRCTCTLFLWRLLLRAGARDASSEPTPVSPFTLAPTTLAPTTTGANWALVAWLAALALFGALTLSLPPLRTALQLEPLTPREAALALGTPVATWAVFFLCAAAVG
jgi:hypothetical protein